MLDHAVLSRVMLKLEYPDLDQASRAAVWKAMFEAAANQLPIGRVGTSEEVAEAILFAMTNRYTTGAIIDCDGGVRHG